MATKKATPKMTLEQVQIFIFAVIGGAIGLCLSVAIYLGVFSFYLAQERKYIEEDWSKVEYFTNRITDQVITLRKMLLADKANADYEKIDTILDLRARVIGGDTLDDKVPLMQELIKDSSDIVAYYNKRMDLRRKHFDYIKWGMDTQPLFEEFSDKVTEYNEAADDFNGKIKRRNMTHFLDYVLLPYKWIADFKKYKLVPLAKGLVLTPVQTATEEYTKQKEE